MVQYISSMARRIAAEFPARLMGKQKQAFRTFLLQELADLGWEAEVVTGGRVLRSHNVVTKNPDPDIILLAHYDTIGRDPIGGLLTRLFGLNSWLLFAAGFLFGHLLTRLSESLIRIGVSMSLSLLLTFFIGISPLIVIVAIMLIPNKYCLNDNTSGVLALLSIARALNDYPALKQKVQLAFVDLEELGLHGSRHLRRHWLEAGVNLREKMIINFDCVGWGQVPVVCSAGERSKSEALFRHLQSSRSDTDYGKLPSDHLSFKCEGAAGVIFANPAPIGKSFYVPNVHSSRDVHLEPRNITWLTEEIIRFCDLRQEQ